MHVAVSPLAPVVRTASATPPTGDYYAAAAGLKGTQLLSTLERITKTGQKDLGYNGARDAMFGAVDDPTNSNSVIDIYTGVAYAGVSDSRTGSSIGHMNTEHTWVQSQGASGIAKCDLHHLMPSDMAINGAHGSLPYGEVTSVEWKSEGGVTPADVNFVGKAADGHRVFEPRAVIRGDIARAQLYFFMRYDGDRQAKYSLENFREALPTLLKWNAEDPVDAAEIARNEAIYKVQGNRNPFIDHPEFVGLADFPQALAGARALRPRR
jgi:endonuclease I